MAKKRGGGQARQPQRRTAPAPASGKAAEALPVDSVLIQAIRSALRAEEPIELLVLVAGGLDLADPRHRSPARQEQPVVADLVEVLIGTSYAETTAALIVIRSLITDEPLVARIDRELSTRRQPMPRWLGALAQAAPEPEVWVLTHVLGDSSDYLIGATLASGHELSTLIHLDHNLGALQDAFVAPVSLAAMRAQLGGELLEGQTLTPTDPAMARAVIEEAIASSALFFPPVESEDWPVCRPLVEWLVRMHPAGGEVPARPEWSDADKAALVDEFFASSYAQGLDHADERGLLDTVLWFGTDYGPGDPLRWSPPSLEILLEDWFPRKVVADTAYLAKLPPLLRGFVRYSHHRQGVPAALTDEVLEVIEDLEPYYQRTIRSSRLQGPEALAAMVMDARGDGSTDELEWAVGGGSVLMSLGDEPLLDEPFEWAGLPEDICYRVGQVLAVCDRCADELLDVEHRTAMRRFLSRAAVGDPNIFRVRSGGDEAAAIAWVITRANRTFEQEGAAGSVEGLLAWFGLQAPELSEAMTDCVDSVVWANGVDPEDFEETTYLETPDLLTSGRRRELIAERDLLLAEAEPDGLVPEG